MKAIIDIKTPAGQSLEGFPKDFSCNTWPSVHLDDRNNENKIKATVFSTLSKKYVKDLELHKGDKIIIEIL